MPKEGFTTVTMKTYRWEQCKKYFKAHKGELRKKGIKSASMLIDFWLSEKLIESG